MPTNSALWDLVPTQDIHHLSLWKTYVVWCGAIPARRRMRLPSTPIRPSRALTAAITRYILHNLWHWSKRIASSGVERAVVWSKSCPSSLLCISRCFHQKSVRANKSMADGLIGPLIVAVALNAWLTRTEIQWELRFRRENVKILCPTMGGNNAMEPISGWRSATPLRYADTNRIPILQNRVLSIIQVYFGTKPHLLKCSLWLEETFSTKPCGPSKRRFKPIWKFYSNCMRAMQQLAKFCRKHRTSWFWSLHTTIGCTALPDR